ncbi:hypothetical protein OG900_16165 [Streptomyces sp. NBC_00433]
MRSPDELGRVPWHELGHAFGSADDVPRQIRALYLGDEEAAREAIYELHGTIHHQGSIYPASAPAVPFLAHAALYARDSLRAELLTLLATLADHLPEDTASPHWPGSSVAGVCAELARVMPDLLPCVRDPDRAVRRAALRVVAAVADLLPAELKAIAAAEADVLYAEDPVPAVRADAMVVRAMLGGEPARLDDPVPEVRLAAAVFAAERSGPPYAPEVVDVLTESRAAADPEDDYPEDSPDGATGDYPDDFEDGSTDDFPGGFRDGFPDEDDLPVDDDFPWPGTEGRDADLTRLLLEDPAAALSVAARWAADGDVGNRGSWLAEEVANDWRDREAAVIDVLLSALPHQRSDGERANRVDAIGRWVALHPSPGQELRDTLFGYARGDERLTARPALLALVRARDPRAIDLLADRPGPSPTTLRAASVYFPGAGDRLIAVVRRELAADPDGGDATNLIEALAGFGTAALRAAVPDLIARLPHGYGAIAAARHLGLAGVRSREAESALLASMRHRETKIRAAAAVAHYQLTGDPGPALEVFRTLLSSPGFAPLHVTDLEALGRAAAPLLPLVEPLLTDSYEPARVGAAQAVAWLTGSPARSVPVLTASVAANPVGFSALKALAAIAPVPAVLHPALHDFATSPRRLIGPTPTDEIHPDEQLRTLARRLLAR